MIYMRTSPLRCLAACARAQQGTARRMLSSNARLDISPSGWLGPRGNFAPSGSNDPFLGYPTCEETLFTSPPGLINLDTGAPCQALLKRAQEAMVTGFVHWNSRGLASTMQYGPTVGTKHFRTQLANFLTAAYGNDVSSKCLFQTAGATHGFALALSTWFGRTNLERRTCFIEDPTYFLAPAILKDHGFNMDPIPVRASDGIDLARLETRVLAAKAEGRLARPDEAHFAGVVYCIPSYHNPTGSTMNESNRRRLVDFARAHNLLVVADDVYELLHYASSPEPPPRLVSYDLDGKGSGNVLGNGTFSKIMSPGVRCGWVEAHPSLINRLSNAGTISSSGAPAQLMGSILASTIETGEAANVLHDTREMLAERMAAVSAVFAARAPAGCSLSVPSGGMCAWLSLPEHVDVHAVLVAARRRG